MPLAKRNTDPEYVVPEIRDGKRLDIDIEGNDIFICVTLAKEIATLFTLPSMQWPQSEAVTNWLDPRSVAPQEIRNLRGVYFMDLDHHIESHSFVLSIQEDKITVFNGYGGAEDFCIFEHDREAWCDDFEYFFLEADALHQDENYEHLWGSHGIW